MHCEVHRISPNEESIYVINLKTGTVRKFSVPGAEDAWITGTLLIIKCSTGYFWEIEPHQGSRRRIQGQ